MPFFLGDVAEIPLVLLQNVAKFCRNGGLLAITNLLNLEPSVLPHSLAHGLGKYCVISNLKEDLLDRRVTKLVFMET